MIIGSHEFNTDAKCYVMGILNVTPDSFSDGGKWNSIDRAILHAEEMIQDGADIIDIGGESTRPGYRGISAEEELERVLPVIEALACRIDIPISIDTVKSAVASAAINAGAVLVNDIYGLKSDSKMAGVIANAGVACCLMHNRDNTDYVDFLSDIQADLLESVRIAKAAGIKDGRIILDPGIGFAKSYELDLLAINRLDLVKELGYPVLLGLSRKRVIGTALGLPAGERMEGSLAAAVVGVMRGCSFIRAHDVKETKRAVTMCEAIVRQLTIDN